MKELEAALDAYEPKALKAGKEMKAQYEKSLAAVQDRVKVVEAHADDKDLEAETGKVFQILKDIAKQASTRHYAETTYRFEFLEDALVAFETALAKKQMVEAEYEAALSALQTRTAPLSVMSNYEKLKDGYTKICDRLEKMKALGEEKKFAEGLKLAEPLNKAIDTFIAAFEKLDAAARGDLDKVVPQMRAQYDAIAKKLAPSTEVANLAKQVGDDVRWLETMVGDGMYSTASGSTDKIQKDLDKLEELNAFKLADEAIVERLGLLSMNAGRTEEKLKTLNDKAFELAAKIDELASKEDYKGALKLVAPTEKALDAYEAELAKVEESDKVFAKECIGPLRARYDAIAGNLAPDPEVKDLAKEVETGLKTLEAAVNGHRYSNARKEEPKVSKDLDKLEEMNPYKLADEAIYQRMKAITWPSGDEEEQLKALSDKSGELGAQMDKLAEKGDYKGALKLAGPLNKVLDDYEAEFAKVQNREADAKERLRALQSEFDAESGDLADLQDVRDKAAEIEALLKEIDTAINDGKYDLAREKEPLFAKLITELVELNNPVRVAFMQDLQEFERKLAIPLDPPTKDLKDLQKYILKGSKEMNTQAAKKDYEAAAATLSRLTGLLNDLAAQCFAHEDKIMKEYDDALDKLQERTAPLSVMSNYEQLRKEYDKICDQLEKYKALGDEDKCEEALKLVDPLNKAIDSFIAKFEKLDGAARGKLEPIVPKMRAQYDAIAADLSPVSEVTTLAKTVGGDVKWLETMLGDGMYSTALQSLERIPADLDRLEGLNAYKLADEAIFQRMKAITWPSSDADEKLSALSNKASELGAQMDTLGEKEDYKGAVKLAGPINKALDAYEAAYEKARAADEKFAKECIGPLRAEYESIASDLASATEVKDLAKKADNGLKRIEAAINGHRYGDAREEEPKVRELLDQLRPLNDYMIEREELQPELDEFNDKSDYEELLKAENQKVWTLQDKMDTAADKGDYAAAMKFAESLSTAITEYLEAYKTTDEQTEFLLKKALPDLKDNFDTAWDVPLPSKEMNDLADRIQEEIGDIDDSVAKKDFAEAQDTFQIASDLLDELMKLGKDPKRKKLLKAYDNLADRVANAEVSDDPALKQDQKAIQSAYDDVKKLAGEGDYKNAGKQLDKVNKLMDAYAAKLKEVETKAAA